MAEFLTGISLFPLVLTLGAFQVGRFCQQKWKSPVCNPILIAVLLVIPVLLLTKLPYETYQKGTNTISWLLTPATVCMALPLYEQLKVLKKSLPAALTGIAAGTLVSLGCIAGMCLLLGLDRTVSVSLLPKSITTAIGIVLSEDAGGIPGLTTVAILVTGISGNLLGPWLCKVLKITDPVAQGVALGTACHVIGTSRATEMGKLQGAVGSLSLTVAGILTAILFPMVIMLF
jgi:predicted murein hydrolase (TIGR00659 family)